MLIERSEIVTGGASAAYGSDAIAGVVNVILNKKLSGLRAQVDYGVSNAGDGDDYHTSLAGGADFMGDRGHFILGAEYEKQDGIGNCFERSWCRPGAIVTNNNFNTPTGVGYGLPNFVRNDSSGGYWMTTGGVVMGPANANLLSKLSAAGVIPSAAGLQFDANGNPVAYTPGSL